MLVADAEVDRAEMLSCLGYRGQSLDESLREAIDEVIDVCEREVSVKGVYRIVNGKPDDPLADSALVLPGDDIAKHLEGACAVAIMACTLGLESEMFLRREKARGLTRGLLVDAACSAYVESGANKLQAVIEKDVNQLGLFLGKRYSPGYGDLPLSAQKTLLRFLDGEKSLGITLTPEYTMIPTKSVTAVAGLFEAPPKDASFTCSTCAYSKSCPKRLAGRTCCET